MSALPFDSATYAVELEAKANRLRELLAPFDAPQPQVFDSPMEHFRLRAEFRLWRDDGWTARVIDYLEIHGAITDDATHANRNSLPENMDAVAAARQSGYHALQRAR